MSGRKCPSCQGPLGTAHVTSRGLVCPHCQNPLGEVTLSDLSLDDANARRMPKPVVWILIALGLLLVSGLIASLLIVLFTD